MNKLAEFPLERAGFAGAPDDTVIVSWPGWSLTVGDVRTAVASQHSVTGIVAWRYRLRDKEGITPDTWSVTSDSRLIERMGTEWEVEALARATPLESTAATQPEQAQLAATIRATIVSAKAAKDWKTADLARDALHQLAALAIPASTAASEQQAGTS